MANCIITNKTVEETTDMVLKERALTRWSEKPSQAEVMTRLLAIRDVVESVPVESKYLDKWVRRNLHLTDDEMVDMYKFKHDSKVPEELRGKIAAKMRGSTMSKIEFIGSLGIIRAKKLSESPDSIIKRDAGIKTHFVLQHFIEQLVDSGKSEHIMKNREIPGYVYEYNTTTEVQKATKFNDRIINNLEKGAKEVLNMIVREQKSIDPKGQVAIFTEQFVSDFDKMGATLDLMFIFSDGSWGKMDFKTISVYADRHNVTSKGELKITKEDWLPKFKVTDFTLQSASQNRVLVDSWGLPMPRLSRIVPINVKFEAKAEKDKTDGSVLKDNLTHIAIGTHQDSYLSFIPVGELTGIEELDKILNKTMINRDNILKRANQLTDKMSSKYNSLIAASDRLTKIINNIIVDKDLGLVVKDFEDIVKKYIKIFQTENIDQAEIEGVENPNYMDGKDLVELRRELESYRDILSSSMEFIKEVSGKEYNSKLEKYANITGTITAMINGMLGTVKEKIAERALSKEEHTSLKDSVEGNYLVRNFRSMGKQINMVISKFNEHIDRAHNNTRVETQKFEKDLKNVVLGLETWAKNNGMSQYQAQNKYLIDNESGNLNLNNKFKQDFYKDLRQFQEKNNSKELDKLMILKKDAKERYKIARERYIAKNKPLVETAQWRSKLKYWEQNNSIESMKFGKNWYVYYEINPNIDSKYYTDAYNFMLQPGNEGLLNYYNFWRDSMSKARKLYGAEYGTIPDNFLPWIRTDIVERAFTDGFNHEFFKSQIDAFINLQGEDHYEFGDTMEKGMIDPNSETPMKRIPKYFTTPLKNASGRIDSKLKSKNLNASLLLFMNAAIAYHYKETLVEPHVEALRDVLMDSGVRNIYKGKDKELPSGLLSRIRGKLGAQNLLEMYDRYVNAQLYGLNIQDADPTVAKRVLAIKKYQQQKELALAVLTWAGNFAQVKTNAWMEGQKGYFYTSAQYRKAKHMRRGIHGKDNKERRYNKEVYDSLTHFIEPTMGRVNIKAKNITSIKPKRWINSDTLFIGFRVAEESVNNDALIAIMQNYGWSEDGTLERLKRLPEGTKSLLELTKIDGDNLIIEGIVDKDGNINIDNYTALRNLTVGVAEGIKGQMNPEDTVLVNTSLVGSMFMTFKNWMPGMVDERIGGIVYDKRRNAIVEGKYTALFTDMGREDKSFLDMLFNVVAPSLGRFMLDISTFGWAFGHGLKYKVNEHRAQAMFNAYKEKYKNDHRIQKMKFEDFLEYKQGQIKSLAAELTIILSLMMALMWAKTDWDDDGQPEFKKWWWSRTMYRWMNRARREIGFFVNVNDWKYTFFRAPIPAMGLVDDLYKWIDNTRDEMGDLMYGEDVERRGIPALMFKRNIGADKKPLFYHTTQFIPGQRVWRMFEAFEQDVEREY